MNAAYVGEGIARNHIESTIDACGRTFRIVVWDRQRRPFEAQVLEQREAGYGWHQLMCFATRTDAIKLISRLAVAWLEGHYSSELSRVAEERMAKDDAHFAGQR